MTDRAAQIKKLIDDVEYDAARFRFSLLTAAKTLSELQTLAYRIATQEEGVTAEDLVQKCIHLQTPDNVSIRDVDNHPISGFTKSA